MKPQCISRRLGARCVCFHTMSYKPIILTLWGPKKCQMSLQRYRYRYLIFVHVHVYLDCPYSMSPYASFINIQSVLLQCVITLGMWSNAIDALLPKSNKTQNHICILCDLHDQREKQYKNYNVIWS